MKDKSVADIEVPWTEPELNSGLIQRCKNNWSVPISQVKNHVRLLSSGKNLLYQSLFQKRSLYSNEVILTILSYMMKSLRLQLIKQLKPKQVAVARFGHKKRGFQKLGGITVPALLMRHGSFFHEFAKLKHYSGY